MVVKYLQGHLISRSGQYAITIFSYDALKRHGVMDEIHTSPLVWAEKAGKALGRTCLHASKGSRHFQSYNDMIDHQLSEKWYPIPFLPLLPDIADLACDQRDANPGEILAGAIIDVTAAYNQCALTVNAAKMTATKINVPNGVGGWIIFIAIYLVGIFGCSTAGNVYCQCAKSIDELHNPKGSRRRSHTYSDDGMIIDTEACIRKSVSEYIAGVEALFGKKNTINMSKVRVWSGELVGIGWHFDFKSWTVQPKERGMAKLLLALFQEIPVGAQTTSEKDLEKVAGTLTWYAAGIPAGAKFVSSLHANKFHMCQKSKRISITQQSQDDLLWWRALMVVAFTQPRKIAASISSVRRTLEPNLYLKTDASSLIGRGAYVSETKDGPEIVAFYTQPVRWTRREMETFHLMKISINVLEYFMVIYHVMLHGEAYRGSVIHIECDNTSAIAWIMKNKTKNNTTADALARIFSLFCLTYNITIICIHIKGIDNIIADFRSRDLQLAPQDVDEELPNRMDTVPVCLLDNVQRVGEASRGSLRAKACRKLLEVCVTMQDKTRGHQILKVLTSLRGTRGPLPTGI